MAPYLMPRVKMYAENVIKRPPAHAEAKSRVIGTARCASYAKAKALLKRLER